MTSLGEYAFAGSDLESFTLPPAIKTIPNGLFQDCANLQSFTIPDDVTSIGSWAFGYCTSLSTLTIPASVTSVGDYAFYCTNNMHYMTWKSSNPPACPQQPFYNWVSLIVPRGAIDAYTNAGWKNVANLREENMKVGDLYYTVLSESERKVGVCKGYVVGSDGYLSDNRYEGEIVVPATITYEGKQYTVTELCERAFEGCYTYTLRNGTVRNGVTSITLPSTLQRIGMYALAQTSITSLFLPKSVISLGMWYNDYTGIYMENPFAMNNQLETIVVEAGNPYYDSREGCNAIIRKSDNTLLASSRNTVIPKSVKKIGPMAFSRSGMEHLVIPESVEEIEPYAFYDFVIIEEWPGLKSVSIPTSVKKIGKSAFETCWQLESIEIPGSITALEPNVFSDCYNLKAITLPANLTDIKERAFDAIDSLSSIHFPDRVKHIGKAAFRYTERLQAVRLPAQIEVVDSGAFAHGQNLKTIIIPATLKSASHLAFYSPKLQSVTALSATPAALGETTFGTDNYPLNATATLLVPAGSKSRYQSATGWNKFMNIEEFSSTCKLEPLAIDAVKGTTAVLPITMTDGGTIKGLQFDLLLPAGITVATDANGVLLASTDTRTSRHSVSGSKIADGHYRFTVSSLQNRVISGTQGTVVNITLRTSDAVMPADYEVVVTGSKLSDNGDVKVFTADAAAKISVLTFRKGDVNGDGNVNVVDVTGTIGYILNRAPSPFMKDAADAYTDGVVDIMDVTTIIDIALGKMSANPQNSLARRAAANDGSLNVADLSLLPGGEAELVLNASLPAGYVGFGLELNLPDGLSLKCDEDGYPLAELCTSGTDHQIATYKNGNKYTFICASMNNRVLPASDKLMKLTLQADASASGTLEAIVNNIVFSKDQDANEYRLADVTFNVSVGGQRGDINGDKQVNVTDVSELINIILGKAANRPGSDINGDGKVNVTDVSELINIILGK